MATQYGLYSDGLIDLKCSKCGETICRMAYKGFSTAICHKCAKADPTKQEENPEKVEAEFETFFQTFGRAVETVKEVANEVVDATAKAIGKRVKKKSAGPRIKLKDPKET
jgi:hypothetical protein